MAELRVVVGQEAVLAGYTASLFTLTQPLVG